MSGRFFNPQSNGRCDIGAADDRLQRIFADTLEGINLNGGQLAGYRSKTINGKMDNARRGNSFAAVANAYTLDRWFYGVSGSGVVTVSQQLDAPATNEFQNSLRVTVTTADASIAAGDTYYLLQPIEGYNVRDLLGRTFSFGFWVRSPKTGIHCVSLRNGGSDRSFVAEYTVNAVNTWEFKTITVTGGLITAGTWSWINALGLSLGWALAAGSTFQTAAGAWQTGNFLATSNQVNCLDTNGNIFAITGVQLEPGTVSTAYEHRSYQTELMLCERYLPAVYNAGLGVAIEDFGVAIITAANSAHVSIPFRVQPRVPPTGISVLAPSAMTLTTATVSSALTGITWGGAGFHGARVVATTSGAVFTVSHPGFLYFNTAGAYTNSQILFTGSEL